ncbi:MAG: carbon monoxide dehydrogenase [Streptosporangiales bacterium]|nr:carbon monoxide dehydrogenase [Streptosporangiales bacterium]
MPDRRRKTLRRRLTVELRNDFQVSAPVGRVWEYLLDIEQVAPCMPGAELTETVDERTWKGKVTVKLGPLSLAYSGQVAMTERDEDSRRVVFDARGTESRGRGTARATIASELESAGDDGTRVSIVTDLALSGAAAQYGRNMVSDVSRRLTNDFASCLQQRLSAEPAGGAEDAEGAAPSTPRPLAGGRLALWTLWQSILRLLRRIGGSSRTG